MPLLTCVRAEDRGSTDLLGEIKAVNRLSERRFPSCTMELRSQVGPLDDLQRVTFELEGPPSELGDTAEWFRTQLRDRGVICHSTDVRSG